METLEQAIRKYGDILAQEAKLISEKERLRALIQGLLVTEGRREHRFAGSVAKLTSRITLRACQEPILKILNAQDLLPFASFSPKKVSELLVPKYGREALLECFEVTRTDMLLVRRERLREEV